VSAIHKVIKGCDALILCGLSAQPPDKKEVESYLENLSLETPVIHVIYTAKDIDNDAGQLLRTYSPQGYSSLYDKDVGSISEQLESIFK
jgi:hypothetical protein